MTDDGPDEVAARLPRPREDEPQSLRQDIVDELADHLACSVLRERLRSDEKQSTDLQLWQRVIHRFGSPSQLARQLWFDWMWEKIMMQRITTFLLFVLVLGCGALLYSMNNTLQNSRLQQAVMLQELMQLKALGTPEPVKNQPTEWNNLSVKVVYDDEAKTPVAGAVVKCSGQTDHTKTIPNSQMTSSEQGVVDFGLVLYGQYSIGLELPNGVETKNHVASVRPGKDEIFEVVVPKSATRPVKFTRILPEISFDESSIETGRIWYHVRLPYPENATKSGKKGSAVAWGVNETEKQKQQEFFVSQDGVIDASKLTAIEPQDRLIGQVNAEDQRLHRFAVERWIVPESVTPSETAEIRFGKYTFHDELADVYIEMTLNDGRKMLTRVPPSPLVPSVFLQPTNITPKTIQKSFERTRTMLADNSLWAYANDWSADAAQQSAQGSGESSSMMGSGRGDQHDGTSSYGGGYGGLGVASPKPTDPLASMLGQFINFYAGASGTASSSASYGGGGFFDGNVITFSVFPEVASGKHLIEFSTPAAANSFGMINFLDQIDMNDYLITGILGMSNQVEFEESVKYDIQVMQKDADGEIQPVTIATSTSIISTKGLRHVQEPDVMSSVCLLSVSREELLHALDVLQPSYSDGIFPTIMAVASKAAETDENTEEAEAN